MRPRTSGGKIIARWVVAAAAAFASLACGLARADISVSTEFEGGSARVLALDQAARSIRITPAGDEQRGMPNWWFLRIDGLERGQGVRLEVVARETSTPDELFTKWTPLNPVWALPNCAAISDGDGGWRQSSPGERAGRGTIYQLEARGPSLWVAWGPPFTPRDASLMIERLERKHPDVHGFVLATSREGRAVPALRIAADARGAATKRPAIFATARQHAWECGGSWVGVGLVEWWLGDEEPARWLRQHAELTFVPVLDVDHVATGDGGKHARPRDHNRDWSDSPHWPEVAAAQRELRQMANDDRLAVFLDLHNPHSSQRVQAFYVQYPPYVNEHVAALTERFFGHARREFGEIRLNDGKPGVPEHLPVWRAISAPWVSQNGSTDTVAFTVETPWNTENGTPDGYRASGAKMGRALAAYLRERPETKR